MLIFVMSSLLGIFRTLFFSCPTVASGLGTRAGQLGLEGLEKGHVHASRYMCTCVLSM